MKERPPAQESLFAIESIVAGQTGGATHVALTKSLDDRGGESHSVCGSVIAHMRRLIALGVKI
jgi:hypothetical protein